MRINLRAYLQQYEFRKTRQTIYDFNSRMREYMSGIGSTVVRQAEQQ